MNKDQIFIDAVLSCKKAITREFISSCIAKDKTNTIRKYLNSYGIIQLALYLQKLATSLSPARGLSIQINEQLDVSQKKAQQRSQNPDLLPPILKYKKKNTFSMPLEKTGLPNSNGWDKNAWSEEAQAVKLNTTIKKSLKNSNSNSEHIAYTLSDYTANGKYPFKTDTTENGYNLPIKHLSNESNITADPIPKLGDETDKKPTSIHELLQHYELELDDHEPYHENEDDI